MEEGKILINQSIYQSISSYRVAYVIFLKFFRGREIQKKKSKEICLICEKSHYALIYFKNKSFPINGVAKKKKFKRPEVGEIEYKNKSELIIFNNKFPESIYFGCSNSWSG